jgi:PleD family two-component response regulator
MMTEPSIQQSQKSISPDIPSHKESTQLVSEILKRTNQLIQKGELDRAQEELLLANRMAKEQYKKSLLRSVQEKLVAPQMPLTPLPLAPMDAMMATISSARQIQNVSHRETKQTTKYPSEKSQISSEEQINDRSIEFNCYREALAKAWSDGTLTQDEKRHLQELRAVLEILDAEHEMFEKEIKQSCYKEALAKHLSNNPTALTDEKSITELQKIFNISQEEHLQIQHFFKQQKEYDRRDKILIIDDDVPFLNMLATSMTEDGFDVTAVTSSDEAYQHIQQQIPDLILCDVNLPNSTMNGFVLCEKVQENKKFQNIPFIFLTGLTDEKLAITGKELGADDYLMKPIARNALLSTLHGRLKRFRQLKGISSDAIPAFC